MKFKPFSFFDKVFLFFLVAIIITRLLFWSLEEQFNTEQWKSTPWQRYKMADDIVESKLLIGKTRQEVTHLLGRSHPTFANTDYVVYKLGQPPSFSEGADLYLIVVFKGDKAFVVNTFDFD